jgi:acyl-CoA synthetase (AMP-forming)/AMP-acid ligase II
MGSQLTEIKNIYPVQIEDYLRAYNVIKEVAVIGLPDKRVGEISAAIIELKPGCEYTEEEIQAFCASRPNEGTVLLFC